MAMAAAIAPCSNARANEQHRHDRQVERHHDVFHDEQAEDGGRLAVCEAVKVVEQARDDARRRDVGDAREQQRRGDGPAQDQPHREARPGVRDRVEDAGLPRGAKTHLEVVWRVLESQQQQQQDHADLRAYLEEFLARVDRDESALAHEQASEQVQRNGGDADARGDAAKHREHQEDKAQLDEYGSRAGVRAAQLLRRSGWRGAGPCREAAPPQPPSTQPVRMRGRGRRRRRCP